MSDAETPADKQIALLPKLDEQRTSPGSDRGGSRSTDQKMRPAFPYMQSIDYEQGMESTDSCRFRKEERGWISWGMEYDRDYANRLIGDLVKAQPPPEFPTYERYRRDKYAHSQSVQTTNLPSLERFRPQKSTASKKGKETDSRRTTFEAARSERESVGSMIRRRWKTAIRKIVLSGRVRKALSTSSYDKSAKVLTFAEMGDKYMDETIRAKKFYASIRVGLNKKPETDAVCALQNVASFCSFPLHVQFNMVRYGHFIQIEEGRVIIRQGHAAECWYFVITGQAIVTEIDQSGMTKITRTIMKRGMYFGEMGLLNNCPRTCTVTSRRPMQLLALTKDVFLKVFKHQVLYNHQPTGIPYHIRFIRGLPFMKCWPWRNLLNRPSQCVEHFYRKNTVLCTDSSKNDWIYIVKSGKCTVYQYVGSTKASWRDLELWLAHPTVDIDGWPGGKVDTCQVMPRDREAYTLYNRLSAYDITQGDLSHPRLLLPPYTLGFTAEGATPKQKQSVGHRKGPPLKVKEGGGLWPEGFHPRASRTPMREKRIWELRKKSTLAPRRPKGAETIEQMKKRKRLWKPNRKETRRYSRKRSSQTSHAGKKAEVLQQQAQTTEVAAAETTEQKTASEKEHSSELPKIEISSHGENVEVPKRKTMSGDAISAVAFENAREVKRESKTESVTDDDKTRMSINDVNSSKVVKQSPSFQERQERASKAMNSCFSLRKQYKLPEACRATPCHRKPRKPEYEATTNPAYVVIDTLHKGDVFGTDQLDDPRCARIKSHSVAL
ncbi:hypothetical protein BaRGS_00015981, partial [Batillaria attramentaria]